MLLCSERKEKHCVTQVNLKPNKDEGCMPKLSVKEKTFRGKQILSAFL